MSREAEQGTAMLAFAPDHPTAAGHFPGYPIIPGAVLIDEIVHAIVTDSPGNMVREVRAVKFLRPVRPGDALQLRWRASSASDVAFEVVDATGALAVSGALVVDGLS